MQQQHQQQQPGPLLPGHISYSTLNQALARFGKRTGTSAEVPRSRQLQWSPEDTDGEVGPRATQEGLAASAPPAVPEIIEPDLEQDPALMEALWSIITNAK